MQKLILVIVCVFSLNVWCNETIKLKTKFEIRKCFSEDQDNVCSIEYSKNEVIQIILEKVENSDFLGRVFKVQDF
jgi:hypothetical protein